MRAKWALVGDGIYDETCDALRKQGLKVVPMPKNQWCYAPVNRHPDLFIRQIPNTNVLFVEQKLLEYLQVEVPELFEDYQVHRSTVGIACGYPSTAALSALFIGPYCIANFKIMDRLLLREIDVRQYVKVPVNQGYVNCTAIALGQTACLTSDAGICAKVKALGLDCLFVEPEGIVLEHHNHGFIGGASYSLEDMVCFNGSLALHPQHSDITRFVKRHGYGVRSIGTEPLRDMGSISIL